MITDLESQTQLELWPWGEIGVLVAISFSYCPYYQFNALVTVRVKYLGNLHIV